MLNQRLRTLCPNVIVLCAALLTLIGVAANAEQTNWTLRATEYRPVLTGKDHTSEGFLVRLGDGRLRLFFRLDPGRRGDHVSTGGYIARITYDPDTRRWTEPKMVYNSRRYDDRNLHGGRTRDGRIVLFFRRYDGSSTEGRYVIHSEDGGRTWSDLREPKALTGIPGTGRMFYNPQIGKYCILEYRRHRNAILFSEDGLKWDERRLIAEDPDTALTEIAGAWAGDGRIVALIRDDARQHGHPLLQTVSRDNGQTWSTPEAANIPPDGHWGCAPQLIYDRKRDLLIALNSDRYCRPDEKNSLFVCTARPEQIMDDPNGWTLRHELLRPWAKEGYDGNRPVNKPLYGYPTIAPIDEDEYLVVFTERAHIGGTEQADLYSFRLIFE